MTYISHKFSKLISLKYCKLNLLEQNWNTAYEILPAPVFAWAIS